MCILWFLCYGIWLRYVRRAASVQFLSISSSPIPAKVGKRKEWIPTPQSTTFFCEQVSSTNCGVWDHSPLTLELGPIPQNIDRRISIPKARIGTFTLHHICSLKSRTHLNSDSLWIAESAQHHSGPERPSNLMIDSDARGMADLLSFVWKPTGWRGKKKEGRGRSPALRTDAYDERRESPSRNWICGVAG